MSILTKPSTRTHAPPGGQSSWSKSGDYTGDAKKVAAATNAPYQAPMQTGTRIAIACLTGCALVLPAVSSLEAAGAQVVQIAVHEPMQLPFAVQTLLVAPVKPSSILVVGDMPESHWCSANVVEVVLSAILKLGLDNGIPVTCGINFEKSSNIAMDGKKHAAAALHAASLRETPPIASAQIVTASPEVDHPPSVFAVPPSVGKMPPDIKHMMDTFRSGLKHHGAKGIFGLGRKFRIADDNGNGKLSKEEFAKCVKELKLALSEEQTAAIFSHFDADCSGGIDYEEFIVGVRGIMNERRSQLVLAAFKILDVDASGTLELSDVKGKYNAKQHPDVLAGRRLEDEILAEFINTFEGNKGNRDGIVTVKEWLDYYSMLSASVDEDDYWELMIRNAWHMSGGSGWSANSTCRRILVTHADGHQSVEEIKNDLGIGRDDRDAMKENLRAQGIHAVSLDIRGSCESETPENGINNHVKAFQKMRGKTPGSSSLVLG